jgi:transcriptional regulator with XRE-family HTH domain
MQAKSHIQSVIEDIKSAPRFPNGGIYWKADPTLMAKVAVVVIGSGDMLAAMGKITSATGVTESTMRLLIRGNDVHNKPCQVIWDELSAAGLKPVAFTPRPRKLHGKKSNSAVSHHANHQGKSGHLTAPKQQEEPTQAESSDATNFRSSLILARKSKGMSQEQLAAAMDPPVPSWLIARWEITHIQPSVSQLQRLCRALQMTPDKLLGIKKKSRLIYDGSIESKDFRVYINDETSDVRVSFIYKFESKEWCNVMAHIARPKS